jgi:hypothetical protein
MVRFSSNTWPNTWSNTLVKYLVKYLAEYLALDRMKDPRAGSGAGPDDP